MRKSKNRDFGKGVSPWFWCKIGQFSIFSFFCNIGQENVFYDILEREIILLWYKNRKLKKSKNRDFCKGVSPWFWSKIGYFSIVPFLRNIGQENVFYDILERKIVFLWYKNRKLRNSKNRDFCKRVSPWFWSKIGHFSIFPFLPYLDQENVSFDCLEGKNVF